MESAIKMLLKGRPDLEDPEEIARYVSKFICEFYRFERKTKWKGRHWTRKDVPIKGIAGLLEARKQAESAGYVPVPN